MGRLPKKVTTSISSKLSMKTWAWLGVCALSLGIYVYYNLSRFSLLHMPSKRMTQSESTQESVTLVPEMQAPTTQDLQALPMTQESAEEVIAIADLKQDELIQIFQDQEHAAAKSSSKPMRPVVFKRSLGLV